MSIVAEYRLRIEWQKPSPGKPRMTVENEFDLPTVEAMKERGRRLARDYACDVSLEARYVDGWEIVEVWERTCAS